MNELAIIAGTAGRVLRDGSLVALTERYDPELQAILNGSDAESRFQELAAHIVARDFDLTPFVAIDLDRESFFLFGDLVLSLDDQPTSGALSATWLEQSCAGVGIISCGADVSPALAGTALERGCVPAAGFILRAAPSGSVGGSIGSDDTPAARPQGPKPDSVGPAVSAVTVAADILADPHIDLEAIGAPQPIFAVPDEAAANGSSELAEHAAPDDEIADESALSESLQRAPTGTRGRPPAPTLRKPPSDADRPRPRREPGGALAPNSDPTETYERSDPIRSAALATLAFSDGQQINIAGGVLIGRFPTKRGVPDAYDTLTIDGGEVSRVHLDLRVVAHQLLARDCETPNGSVMTSGGLERPLSTGEGDAVSPGDKIAFGNQSVTFVGWVDDA